LLRCPGKRVQRLVYVDARHAPGHALNISVAGLAWRQGCATSAPVNCAC
jgi:hypothetical protein